MKSLLIFIAVFVLFTVYGYWDNQAIPSHMNSSQNELKGTSWTPNSVSSNASTEDKGYIEPLKYCPEIFEKIVAFFDVHYKSTVIEKTVSYLHIVVTTPTMGFNDDLEFLIRGNTVQVRSASRIGYSDMGINRKRIQELRTYLDEIGCP